MAEYANIRWLGFRNDSGEEIPARGIVRVVSAELRDNQWVMICDKPDGSAPRFHHYVNSGGRVFWSEEHNRYGSCAVPDGPVWAAYDTEDTPQPGENWGPRDDSWLLHKDEAGFRIVGPPQDGIVLVVRQPAAAELVEGVLDEALAVATNILTGATTATMKVYIKDEENEGELKDSMSTVTITNRDTALEGEEGDYVMAQWINGEWRIVWLSCGEEE